MKISYIINYVCKPHAEKYAIWINFNACCVLSAPLSHAHWVCASWMSFSIIYWKLLGESNDYWYFREKESSELGKQSTCYVQKPGILINKKMLFSPFNFRAPRNHINWISRKPKKNGSVWTSLSHTTWKAWRLELCFISNWLIVDIV